MQKIGKIGFFIQDGPEDGIRIKKVLKKGPAYRGGLRTWDIVEKINGEKITTSEEFAEVL